MASPITTHVLDTNLGGPAAGMAVTLYKQIDGELKEIAAGVTNSDGRITDWLDGQQREKGVYYMLNSQEQNRAGIMLRPSEEVEPLWLTHFAVKDVSNAAGRVTELGGTVLLEPDPEFRGGMLAVVVDPGGAILALHQWAD